MSVENHQKLKAAFIAGKLDASLAADRGRAPTTEYVAVRLPRWSI